MFLGLCAEVGGCGSSAPVLPEGPSGSIAVPDVSRQQWKMVALAPMYGASPRVQEQMLRQITQDALGEGVVIRGDAGAKVDFTLRGYLLIKSEKKFSKVVYVWDVLDQQGVRVGRVSGEEIVEATYARDRGDAVTPAVLAIIGEKAVRCLAASVAVASPGTGASALGVGQRG